MLYLANSKTNKILKTNNSYTKNQINKRKRLDQNCKPMVGKILHTRGCCPRCVWFKVTERRRSLDYSNFIKIIGLNQLFHTLCVSRILLDQYPFTLNLVPSLISSSTTPWGDTCLSRTCSGHLELSFPENKRHLELNRSTWSPTIKCHFSILWSWYSFMISLYINAIS